MQFLCVFLLARTRSPIAVTDHAASLVGTVSPKLVAKAKRGLDLPTVTADGLQSCRARVSSTTLLGCALLLPAGTGTQSLHDLMTTVLGSARHAQYVHHLHHVRMTAWWKGNGATHLPRIGHNVSAAPAPKCFLMSLRDPAARLRSGFAYVSRHDGWGPGLSQQVALPSAAAKTYRGFVAAMRDPQEIQTTDSPRRYTGAVYPSRHSGSRGTGTLCLGGTTFWYLSSTTCAAGRGIADHGCEERSTSCAPPSRHRFRTSHRK